MMKRIIWTGAAVGVGIGLVTGAWWANSPAALASGGQTGTTYDEAGARELTQDYGHGSYLVVKTMDRAFSGAALVGVEEWDGVTVLAGDPIPSGVYQLVEDGSGAPIELITGAEVFTIDTDPLVFVGSPAAPLTQSRSCTVTCGSDHHACCALNGNNPPTCQCKPNDEEHICQTGGPGATRCSVSHSATVFEVVVNP